MPCWPLRSWPRFSGGGVKNKKFNTHFFNIGVMVTQYRNRVLFISFSNQIIFNFFTVHKLLNYWPPWSATLEGGRFIGKEARWVFVCPLSSSSGSLFGRWFGGPGGAGLFGHGQCVGGEIFLCRMVQIIYNPRVEPFSVLASRATTPPLQLSPCASHVLGLFVIMPRCFSPPFLLSYDILPFLDFF